VSFFTSFHALTPLSFQVVYRGIAFPKTHSLVRLMDLLESTGCDIPAGIKEADELTRYAVETRYPELEEEVTEAEIR
jgi:HEPN domain-containing protein